MYEGVIVIIISSAHIIFERYYWENYIIYYTKNELYIDNNVIYALLFRLLPLTIFQTFLQTPHPVPPLAWRASSGARQCGGVFVLPAALQQGVDVVSGVFQAILVQHTGPAHAGQVIVLGYHDIPGAHSVDQSEDQAVSALIEHQRLGRFSLDAMGRVAEDERWHPVTFVQADGQVYHRQPSALINTVGMARLLCLFCRLYS